MRMIVETERGRKAPFKIKPLVTPARQTHDLSTTLAELRAIARPGNMDALGAAWKEIGADARKALAAELPALKAACEAPAEDVPFDEQPERTLASELERDDEPHPAQAKADAIIAEIMDANAIIDVNSIYSRHKADIEAMPGEIGATVDVAADKRKREIEAERAGMAGAK